jgi:hypothetical protein
MGRLDKRQSNIQEVYPLTNKFHPQGSCWCFYVEEIMTTNVIIWVFRMRKGE